MNIDRLIELGFKRLPHPAIGQPLIYNLNRNRVLSIGSFGTPNEVMFICQLNDEDNKKIDDLVCIHNYDYDGYLTEEKISLILQFFK